MLTHGNRFSPEMNFSELQPNIFVYDVVLYSTNNNDSRQIIPIRVNRFTFQKPKTAVLF